MTSKSLSQNAFLNPDLVQDTGDSNFEDMGSRRITVYDAVAGRISAAGFISKILTIPSARDTPSSSTSAVAPESVLFRQKRAPTRFIESDIYFANEREPGIVLPESDLLKALHCYTADHYSSSATTERNKDYRSMDETALLAFGILMEEAARNILGRAGDLVFTEGEEDQDSPHRPANSPPGSLLFGPEACQARPLKKRRTFND